METASIQEIPLHTRLLSTTLWAVNGVANVVSKTVDAWVHTPKAMKLPFQTAALLYAPKEWAGAKGALATATIITETPKSLTAFLNNQPFQYIGERWQLFDYSFPRDPKSPLTDLDKKIGTFERAQPSLFTLRPSLNSVDSPLSTPIASPPSHLHDMAKITDRKLRILIEKVSYLSILKSLHSYCGVSERDATPLLSLVDEASSTPHPSLWKIFLGRYGSKMSFWGRLKTGFIYLFLWHWVPIIPRTVDAYMKNMLSELRINLREDGEKRKKFINGLLEDADNFFEVYNGAAETYATDSERKGNLNHYRKNAVDRMFPREDLGSGKTAEQLRKDLYRKLSSSIVDHFSPKVTFGFLEGWLNSRIQNILRDQILPDVFLGISEGGQEATQRHNIPFFLALTKTLTLQVSKIQGKMEEESTDSSSLYGIKNFEAIVKKFLWTIDMADCKSPEEVRAKMGKLKEPWTGIEGEVRNGIQFGIQKGLSVFFDYLSKQENTEELFANLFESVTSPLSGHLPMNDRQWAEMAVEYEGTKILLKQAAYSLSRQIVHAAVQDKVRGGRLPEATERAARAIFSEHKARGKETFEELLHICDKVREKLLQPKDFCDSETSIHPELASIASVLKAFENKERVKITMDQDPPPKIATLPHAEQEAILRVLYPLYEGSDQMMDIVLALQNLQKQHTSQIKIAHELKQIKDAIEEIGSNKHPQSLQKRIKRIAEHFRTIKNLDPRESARFKSLVDQTHLICRSLQQLAEEERALKALSNLLPIASAKDGKNGGLIDMLILSVQGTPPADFKKWKCIEQIKQNIKLANFSAESQQKIFDLVEKMSKFNSLPKPRPDFYRDIWEPLSAHLSERKAYLEKNQKQALSLLQHTLPQALHHCSLEKETSLRLSQDLWEAMKEKGDLLQTDASKFYRLIGRAKKETHLHPSAAQVGQVGGTLGFFAGFAMGTHSPEAGSVLGAATATGVANLSSLAKGQWVRFSIPVLGAGAAAGVATRYLADAANTFLPSYPLVPALIGAAGASAGLEYAGAKMTQRLIDTGVDVAMPKVAEIFDSAYEHLLTNDIVINGGLKIMMKQIVDLFPPKN